MTQLESQLAKAKSWLYEERLSPEEFTEFKTEAVVKIEVLERRLAAKEETNYALDEMLTGSISTF